MHSDKGNRENWLNRVNWVQKQTYSKREKYTDNTDLKNYKNAKYQRYPIYLLKSFKDKFCLLVHFYWICKFNSFLHCQCKIQKPLLFHSMASLLLCIRGSRAIACCIKIFFLSKRSLLIGPWDDSGTPQHSDSRPSL